VDVGAEVSANGKWRGFAKWEITRAEIRAVYGDRLAESREDDGMLNTQPKQVGRSEFGNVIHVTSLYVNRNKPNPVVLNDQSVFRVQGRVDKATEIHVGIGAFGTTQARAESFMTSQEVDGEFDLQIPASQFRIRRTRAGGSSPVGVEVFVWFCLTSGAGAQLENSNVELKNKE